jgi:hypothetical protein
MHPVISQLDPLSFTTARLQPFYNETHLSNATGFFIAGTLPDGSSNFWLVTNWHVLTGRNINAPHKALHSQGCIPNRLRVNLILKSDQPEYQTVNPGQLLLKEIFIELYDSSGAALWLQHPQKSAFDIGILNLQPIVGQFEMRGVNQLASQYDMAIEIGNQVFILGYPLGFQHFMETPIWKSGIIASEPHLETTETRNRVVIDGTTRQGMSGSPVIMRQKTHSLSEKGEIIHQPNASRFIGIYSSRPDIPWAADVNDEDRRVELGYFYKAGCIDEAIRNGIPGPHYGELP